MKYPAPAWHSGGQQQASLPNYRVQNLLLQGMIVRRESCCCVLAGSDHILSWGSGIFTMKRGHRRERTHYSWFGGWITLVIYEKHDYRVSSEPGELALKDHCFDIFLTDSKFHKNSQTNTDYIHLSYAYTDTHTYTLLHLFVIAYTVMQSPAHTCCLFLS